MTGMRIWRSHAVIRDSSTASVATSSTGWIEAGLDQWSKLSCNTV